MKSTGDQVGSEDVTRTAGMPVRRKSPLSQKISSSGSMRNLLSPVKENAPPAASGDNAEIAARKQEHRPIRKVIIDSSPTRESCPYHREDSATSIRYMPSQGIQGSPPAPRFLQQAPLGGRESGGYRFETSVANFEASLRTSGPTSSYRTFEDDIYQAEKVPEARRDWTFAQEKPIVETLKPQWHQTLRKSPSAQSISLHTSFSVRSLGSQASPQLTVPIHSVRVRQVEVAANPGIPKRSWKY